MNRSLLTWVGESNNYAEDHLMNAPVWVNLLDAVADLEVYRPTPRRPVPLAETRAVDERRRRPPPPGRGDAGAAKSIISPATSRHLSPPVV